VAESAEHKRARGRCSGTLITIMILAVGAAASTAFAATVTQAPTISGQPADPATFTPGVELSASAGAWTPASADATYDWLRCNSSGTGCQGISGACGRSYTVRLADEGQTLRVRLTATESENQTDSADSAPTGVVAHGAYFLPPEVEPDTCTKVTTTGSGKGTFISGTQVGAGSEPSADTNLPFIKPFPVIRIKGRFKGKLTTVTRVTVRTPRGTRIRIRCSGKGCAFKRKAVAARLIGLRSLRRTYRPKARIEIQVTKAGKIGKYMSVRTRRGKAPVRVDRCLMPGKTKPVRCPAG
jgi:hypothetical protein